MLAGQTKFDGKDKGSVILFFDERRLHLRLRLPVLTAASVFNGWRGSQLLFFLLPLNIFR
jgi:hypothetical protein